MTEARALLGDVVTRLFTERVTRELLEASEKGEWPAALWHAVEENGLTLPLVPEAKGGAGITWGDACVIVIAAGRHAAPLPLPETIVASWLLAGAGLAVPEGPLTLAPVHAAERLTLSRQGGSGWRLSGAATRVPWGRAARHVVVVDEAEGQVMIALVATTSARLAPDVSIAREPRDTLAFDAAPVRAAAPAAPGVPRDALRLYGAMVRAAQMAGGLEAVLAMATRYATERRQFGKPIGQFQAIQQNLALLAGHTAAAGMAAANAFRAADLGDLAFEVAVAKTRVGEAAGVGAGIAHQTHGAIGFTYEHQLQFVTRRLWSWRAEFGGEGEWAMALGRAVAERGAEALWPYLTAR
jgi:acyl-CoA dehydrogenase